MTETQVPGVEELANIFASIIREWCLAGELAQIQKANAAETNPAICHTHEFFDANEAMTLAFDRFLTTPTDRADLAENQALCDLWNKAWGVAKARGFRVG